MTVVWRLAREVHGGLDGEGARRYGGRWNSPGRPAVYAAETAALAVLEVRVHLDLPLDLLPADYRLISIDLGTADIEHAPPEAVDDPRTYGDRWLIEVRSAVLRVPSVIVPEEWNALINPRHPDAALVSINGMRPFRFDPRLF